MAHPSKILVLHCPAGGGHKAAARAVAEAAVGLGHRVEVADALARTPSWFARAYVSTHLQSTEHAPKIYGYAYDALDQRNALAELRCAFDRSCGARLIDLVREAAPDAVVATHFFPLAVLGYARCRDRLDIPLIGVVTDYAAHAFWAERGVDRFCTPAGRAGRDLVRHGVPVGCIASTGIPVRAAFGESPPLCLDPGAPLRVLVTSGGFGVGPMVEILRSFAGVSDVRLAVICGDSPAKVAQARAVAAEAGVEAEVVGFEPDMPRRMAEAHVVVGKPGGLTVSESLAAGRPLILVGACPGQETLNQAWASARGAALATHPSRAGSAAASLRAHGALLPMSQIARSLGRPLAAREVVEVTLRAIADDALLRSAA